LTRRLSPAQRAAEAEVERCQRAYDNAGRGRKLYWRFRLEQARTAALAVVG